MRNETLIAETSRLLAALPEDKAQTVRDFAAFLAEQLWANLPLVEDTLLPDETEEEFRADLHIIAQQSRAFAFLLDDPDVAENELEVTEHVA